MTTSVTDWAVGDGNALPANRGGKCFVLKKHIDASETNIAAAAIVKLWEIPADTRVMETIVVIRTVEDSTCTLTIGDYLTATPTTEVDLDGYEASMDAEAAVAYSSLDGAAAYATGKFYLDSLDYIGLLFNNAADTVVLDAYAICMDCRP
jgi:hypothetical protein